ncbi:MAG: Xaa-Pro dipeptidase [Bacillales bacterium]|jgi:Xaa-Pro aminopeptidase|nr:Xaa-Pro dipeptidase [Bacillales bacterium]
MTKLEQLRNKFDELHVDGILITNEFNRKYISGFTGSTGVVLISKSEAKFITDFRYIEQATAQCVGFEIVKQTIPYSELVNDECKKMGIKRLAFEQDNLTFSTFKGYESKFEGELVPVSGVVEEQRKVKTADEIAIIQTAAEIADATFKYILDFIKPGITETDVSNEMEFFMRRAGATSSSFDIIVASGWRSALPHGIASNKVIEKGDMVTLDFGAVYNHYVSDMTRTIAVGDPGEKLKEIYAIVLEAQEYANTHIRPGITGIEADALARDIIKAKGYGDYFGHGLGHSIGLEVHEGPNLSFRSSEILVPGNVVTNEPGIYIPHLGGVRIEDDLVITEKGNYPLTISTKELIIL